LAPFAALALSQLLAIKPITLIPDLLQKVEYLGRRTPGFVRIWKDLDEDRRAGLAKGFQTAAEASQLVVIHVALNKGYFFWPISEVGIESTDANIHSPAL
jgi:hypothetical protein